MKAENKMTLFSRNARFLWLGILLLIPGVAFLIYEITPHDELWHEILYSLVCVPLFAVWLVALVGCAVSFLAHRALAKA